MNYAVRSCLFSLFPRRGPRENLVTGAFRSAQIARISVSAGDILCIAHPPGGRERLDRDEAGVGEAAELRAAKRTGHNVTIMAEKMILRGARVAKINSKPDDTHRDGAIGRVINAIGPTAPDSEWAGRYGYWVEWESHPGVPCFIAGSRLCALDAERAASA